MTRIMALDYGTVRIGVAVSDPLGITAQPRDFIKASPLASCIIEISRVCSEASVGKIILGLPLHMNGQEGESAKAARAFGEKITNELNIPVEFLDERLSSASANRILAEGNVKDRQKRLRVDSIAAAIILQNYIDKQESS